MDNFVKLPKDVDGFDSEFIIYEAKGYFYIDLLALSGYQERKEAEQIRQRLANIEF
tara:strand:- start:148 stop:315 length:168 start_codon:yes stop_codon:yes gene_type:complete